MTTARHSPPPSEASCRILGFDPALRCTGYGVLEVTGQRLHAVDCGVIRTSTGERLSECLRRIAGGVTELVESFRPQVVAIEGGFFSKNARTAMVLGAARGALIAAVAHQGCPIYEYAPRRIKQAVCGHGNADKEQIALLLARLIHLDPSAMMTDATDALAVAFCHASAMTTNQGLFLPTPI